MLLHEIINVPQHHQSRFDNNDFDISSKSLVCHAKDNIPVYKIACHSDSNLIMFALLDDNQQVITCVIGYFWTFPKNNTEYFMIKDVYTDPKQQRQGYGTSLYQCLLNKLQIKLWSDNEQTSTGRALWSTISKLTKIKVLDLQDGQIYDRSQISDDQVYVNNPEQHRYVFVTECITTNYGYPMAGDGIIKPYNSDNHNEKI